MPDLQANPSPFGSYTGWPTIPTENTPSGSSFDMSKFGKIGGAVAPLLLSLFGSNEAKGKAGRSADELAKMAAGFTASGKASTATGTDALAPVLRYLKAIASGNPADVLSAAAPERARIMDQYDTARKNISTFTPRGGGTAADINELRAREASDLAVTTAGARTKGIEDLSRLGMGFEQLGVQQAGAAVGAESAAQQAYQQQATEQDKNLAGLGSAIGSALPIIFGLL